MGCCDGCSRCCGKSYLVLLNAVSFFAGLTLCVFLVWAAVSFNSLEYTVLKSSLWIGIGVALVVCLISLMGGSGAYNDNKCALNCYLVFMVVFVLIGFIAASGLFIVIGAFSDVAEMNSISLEPQSFDADLNDYQLSVFHKCCQLHKPLSWSLVNVTSCDSQTACDGQEPNRCACIIDNEEYLKFLNEMSSDTCKTFAGMYIKDDVPLVGNPNDGGCGAGMPFHFQGQVFDYYSHHIRAFAVIIILVCLLQLAAIIFAFHLTCAGKSDVSKSDGRDTREAESMKGRGRHLSQYELDRI